VRLDAENAVALVLHVVNESGAPAEVLNPDLGRPSPQMKWPFSDETYRASLLMSYGYLRVSVIDENGEELEKEPVETFATPALRSPLVLAPGEAVDVVIPLGDFFSLSPGGRYSASVEYGAGVKVRAECSVALRSTGPPRVQ
jgi:hypothetical protein